jgi:hypothetical protein
MILVLYETVAQNEGYRCTFRRVNQTKECQDKSVASLYVSGPRCQRGLCVYVLYSIDGRYHVGAHQMKLGYIPVCVQEPRYNKTCV